MKGVDWKWSDTTTGSGSGSGVTFPIPGWSLVTAGSGSCLVLGSGSAVGSDSVTMVCWLRDCLGLGFLALITLALCEESGEGLGRSSKAGSVSEMKTDGTRRTEVGWGG